MSPTYVIGVSIAFAGFIFTIFASLSSISFKMGHMSARVEELEKWRVNMRTDMHEVSDKMGTVETKVGVVESKLDNIFILIDERTNKRSTDNESHTPLPLRSRP